MKQKKILIPSTNAESWKALLADPEKHWKTGNSAKCAAESWENAEGLPEVIIKAFNMHEQFCNSELLIAIPEFKVPLPGGVRPSQNDLLVVTSNENGLTVVAVEAKVKEDFDKTIEAWLNDISVSGNSGKPDRLNFILKKINLKKGSNIEKLRYQLFHRLASAIIMAEKFHAKQALMIVHSFEIDDKKNHFEDYIDFLTAYNIDSCEKENIYKLTTVNNIEVFALWVYSKP